MHMCPRITGDYVASVLSCVGARVLSGVCGPGVHSCSSVAEKCVLFLFL